MIAFGVFGSTLDINTIVQAISSQSIQGWRADEGTDQGRDGASTHLAALRDYGRTGCTVQRTSPQRDVPTRFCVHHSTMTLPKALMVWKGN